MKTPEGKIKDEIKDWLKEKGAYFFMPVQTGYGVSTLDILCCFRGKFVGIEVKAGRNVPSARQSRVIGEINQAGGLAFAAWNVDDVRLRLEPATGRF